MDETPNGPNTTKGGAVLKLNFRIGTKLGITAGLGVLLVGGMLANEMVGNASIATASRLLNINYANKGNAQSADTAMAQAYLAVRDIEAADTGEQLDKSAKAFQAAIAAAAGQIDAATQRATRDQVRAHYRETRGFIDTYTAATAGLSASQKSEIEALGKRNGTIAAWTKSLDGVLTAPAFTGLANRRDVETILRDASASFNAARAAAWHFTATSEPEQKEQVARNATNTLETLKRARALTGDKDVVAGIDALTMAATGFKTVAEDVIKAEDQKIRIRKDRLTPTAAEIGKRIDKALQIATDGAQNRQGQMNDEMTRVGWVGLVVGLLVVAILIGAAVFSMFNVARPIRRIGDVLLELAKGNKDTRVPYADRFDEIGDAARAARTFRDNVVEQQRLSDAVLQAAKERDEQSRNMEAAVESFRATSDQLLASVGDNASIMHDTAETLTGVAGNATTQAVSAAAASEETATNVQTVAAATEELAISIQEIGRRVEQATTVVRQTSATTERSAQEIEGLAAAGQRIGDVVGLIQAIAAQTNLLALNATIEAARAGEAGRGFAVVASEVKNLAAQTAKATEEIAHQVAGIQDSTKSAVDAVREVAIAMRQIDEVTTAIAGAVEEQGAATREISQNVQMAAAGTQTLSANISSVNGAIGETNRSAEAVRTASDNVSTQTTRISEEVRKFFIALRAGTVDRQDDRAA